MKYRKKQNYHFQDKIRILKCPVFTKKLPYAKKQESMIHMQEKKSN